MEKSQLDGISFMGSMRWISAFFRDVRQSLNVLGKTMENIGIQNYIVMRSYLKVLLPTRNRKEI